MAFLARENENRQLEDLLKTLVGQLSESGQKYSFFLVDLAQVQTRPLKTPLDFC